ncbi:MAG: hypothetical protein ACTJLL_04660, partial [Anaplasma sp.]
QEKLDREFEKALSDPERKSNAERELAAWLEADSWSWHEVKGNCRSSWRAGGCHGGGRRYTDGLHAHLGMR